MQTAQGPVLQDAHRSRALAQDLRDLVTPKPPNTRSSTTSA
jgi:hypothetical protein